MKLLKSNLPSILAIAGGYLFLWFSAVTNADHSYTICIFKNLSGYACPGCGLGRASIELFQGHFHEALHFHWLVIPFHILMLTALVWLIRDLIVGKDTFWNKVLKPMNSWILTLIFLAVIINWVRALYLGL